MGLYIRGPGISLTFTAAVMMPEVGLPRRGLGSSRLSLFLCDAIVRLVEGEDHPVVAVQALSHDGRIAALRP